MSQKSVERVMGRLLTDDGFRRRFAADPRATLATLAGGELELTPCELAALARFDPRAAERCAGAIDPRLLKADLRAFDSETSTPRASSAVRDDARS